MEQAGIGQVMARGNTVAASTNFEYSTRFVQTRLLTDKPTLS